MTYSQIKSYAKINLALGVTGKSKSLHNIESIIAFIKLHDVISIKKIKSKNNLVSFNGKFNQNIFKKDNTIVKLLRILEKKKFLKNKKFRIKVNKKIPNKAGLGGGSMNAASILKFFIKKKIIKINKKEIFEISKSIGSDVILGLNQQNLILTSKNEIRYFNKIKRFHVLIVKPNFGCSTRDIFSNIKKFDSPRLSNPNKQMFDIVNLKKMKNSLEMIVFLKYPKLKKIKSELEILCKPDFIRMTGSGSTLVAYFQTKKRCERAKKMFNKKYKNYWCIASKTI